jgi:hypothetical protein
VAYWGIWVFASPLEGLVIERDLPKRGRLFLRHGSVVMSPQHRGEKSLECRAQHYMMGLLI